MIKSLHTRDFGLITGTEVAVSRCTINGFTQALAMSGEKKVLCYHSYSPKKGQESEKRKESKESSKNNLPDVIRSSGTGSLFSRFAR